ncbi:hypothetical protein R1flu_020112 [Riccia fluitans]|uniref:Uncharacterized protein n=1 Tax=Riccia fluitans TaxID=41844 RepID=A0ABD1ZP53_9MARC
MESKARDGRCEGGARGRRMTTSTAQQEEAGGEEVGMAAPPRRTDDDSHRTDRQREPLEQTSTCQLQRTSSLSAGAQYKLG